MLDLRHAALSDTGRVREANEDAWYADAKQGIYLVADGLGGRAAGQLASQVVTRVLPRLLSQRLDRTSLQSPAAREKAAAAICDLSRQLREDSRDQPGLDGMGATVVAAVVRDHSALIIHLGDSRAYLLRMRELTRLTRDHSLAQMLAEQGKLEDTTDDLAARSQLARYLGMPGEPHPDTLLVELQSGDALLLCSDGLSAMLSDPQIQASLSGSNSPQDQCRSLVEAANAAGGRDNVTALLIRAGATE